MKGWIPVLFTDLVMAVFNVGGVVIANRLTSIEITLMYQLEVVLCPLWVWLVIGLVPTGHCRFLL